jgi:protein involved in polysaccharide export with SLBB domain
LASPFSDATFRRADRMIESLIRSMVPLAGICTVVARSITRRAIAVAVAVAGIAIVMSATGTHAQAQQYPMPGDTATNSPGGPIRLRQPTLNAAQAGTDGTQRAAPGAAVPSAPPAPGEFEAYAARAQHYGQQDLRRFGADLVTEPIGFDGLDSQALVPPDYVLAPGDEVQLLLWGTVDAELRLPVDRTGRINIPRVGAVMVAGVRYADLPAVIEQRVAQVFRNFQLSASLGQLRSVRVYVTGFAKRPGAYTVSSLSTIVNALLRAGGPSAAGSFRSIQLRRGKDVVTTFDLYDLLIRGDKTADSIVQADDVIHIGAVGPQVALIGSVNKPAVFEMRPGDTVQDVLAMAGGFTAVADRTRLAVEHLSERSGVRITQLSLPAAAQQPLQNGDLLRAFSAVDSVLPIQQQNKRVRVEGEVLRPGEYVLPAASTVTDALRAAGDLTPTAFVFGTEFNRVSVRLSQEVNYERALRDLETEITRSSATQRTVTAEEAAAQNAKATATGRLLERLRSVRPTGRVVLQVTPESTDLPALALEDGDRIYVPARPTTVGVFGSVFNGGNYVYSPGSEVAEFLDLAGGATRGADTGSTFVVRANGSVVSSPQHRSWFGSSNLVKLRAEPGDTIFVPEEMNKSTWTQELREWTQIFYQFGLGAAALQTFKE